MLSHQIIFSQSLTPLYQPAMGVPEPEDGVNRRRQTQPSHSATKAAEDYEACMQACKDELTPEIVRMQICLAVNRTKYSTWLMNPHTYCKLHCRITWTIPLYSQWFRYVRYCGRSQRPSPNDITK